MIRFKEIEKVSYIMDEVTCDICGTVYKLDNQNEELEIQEFQFIRHTGGYNSVFGDETEIQCDICQHCFHKIISSYCYVVTDEGPKKFKKE
jgi:hypothetical protein